MVHPIRVKICGITRLEDGLRAAELGACALGFIFYKKSQRYIAPDQAKKIITQLPPLVIPVGVFVNETEADVERIAKYCHLSAIQLQGEESPAYCLKLSRYRIIKAFRVKDDFNPGRLSPYRVSAYLFDALQDKQYGGTGKQFDWKILSAKKFEKPIILSGGISAQNVRDAIKIVHPYAVDLSSSVEKSPGKKDKKKLIAFFDALGRVK